MPHDMTPEDYVGLLAADVWRSKYGFPDSEGAGVAAPCSLSSTESKAMVAVLSARFFCCVFLGFFWLG